MNTDMILDDFKKREEERKANRKGADEQAKKKWLNQIYQFDQCARDNILPAAGKIERVVRSKNLYAEVDVSSSLIPESEKQRDYIKSVRFYFSLKEEISSENKHNLLHVYYLEFRSADQGKILFETHIAPPGRGGLSNKNLFDLNEIKTEFVTSLLNQFIGDAVRYYESKSRG